MKVVAPAARDDAAAMGSARDPPGPQWRDCSTLTEPGANSPVRDRTEYGLSGDVLRARGATSDCAAHSPRQIQPVTSRLIPGKRP